MVETLNVAAPTANTLVSEEIHNQIVAALDHYLLTKENVIYIGEKPKPKKIKKRDGKKLILLDEEPIPSSGTCPGGKYYYITDKDKLLRLLSNWTKKKAWVAIDLETGCAWREKLDEDGETIR